MAFQFYIKTIDNYSIEIFSNIPIENLEKFIPECPKYIRNPIGRRKITIEAPTWSDLVRLYTLLTDITSSTTSVRKTFFKLIKPNNMSKRDVGLWGPTDCKPDEKLAIIVPYRNRDVHLRLFVKYMHEFLRRQQLMYTIFVINQADISNPTGQKFTLSLGFRPISLSISNNTTRELNYDDTNMSNTINVDFNPHMIARQHLEKLLNARKSIYFLATTMLNTLEFFRCVEPLRDQVLSYNGLKVSSSHIHCIQPVCGMLLIALSPSDLILIYRASLSLRITLNIIEHPIVSSAMSLSNNNNDALKTTKSIQLLDAYNQLTTGKKPYPPIFNTDGWNNQMLDDKALCNLAPLPAFSKFLKSLQELFCINSDEKLTSLTLTQFAQLTRLTFDKFKSSIMSSKTFSLTNYRRTDPGPTLLESYLSTS
ncbi:unnamed protein product [Schistosoma intercalatum]|nr:unnamed protein product [Schistosoma intercalatum]